MEKEARLDLQHELQQTQRRNETKENDELLRAQQRATEQDLQLQRQEAALQRLQQQLNDVFAKSADRRTIDHLVADEIAADEVSSDVAVGVRDLDPILRLASVGLDHFLTLSPRRYFVKGYIYENRFEGQIFCGR